MLMAAQHKQEPVKMERRPAGAGSASPAVMSTLSGVGIVAKWAAGITPVGAVAVTVLELTGQMAPLENAIKARVSEIYSKFIGEKGPQEKKLTSDQKAEAERPAPAGKTAEAAKEEPASTPEKKESDELLMTAAIVGLGFALPVGAAGAGLLQSKVFDSVKAAAKVIAPDKSISMMSSNERKAVATAAMVGSTGPFLQHAREEDPKAVQSGNPSVNRKVEELAKGLPSSGEIAKSFMKNGKFSIEQFATLTSGAGSIANLSKLASLTPVGLKMALLAAAAEKAAPIIEGMAAGLMKDADKAGIGKLVMKHAVGINRNVAERDQKLRMDEHPETDEPAPSAA
jgi:hypothetical protein